MGAGDDLNECFEESSEGGRRKHNPIMAALERPDLEDIDGLICLLVEVGVGGGGWQAEGGGGWGRDRGENRGNGDDGEWDIE